MHPVSRPMVVTAGIALAGVCVLGLYLGIQPSLDRPLEADEAPAASSAAAMKPGMAAVVEATPLKTDVPPPSAAPAAQLAQVAKPKAKSDDDDDTPSSDEQADASPQPVRKTAPPEPPTLYSPDEAPAPAPAGPTPNNTPPY